MIQSSTLTFLQQLKRHNERPWFDKHKEKYLEAKADFDHFIEKVILGYGKTDPDIASLTVKDSVFRIYKDIRFSKDKTPYKTHFAAGLNKGGKKVHFPGYYLHVEPGGNSFCGGGIWRPASPELKKIRQEIDYNYEDFLSVVRSPGFKRRFGELSTEDKLVRPPQGYSEDNPAVEYLKLHSFIAGCSFTDEELISKGFLRKIITTFSALKPFIDFLGKALD